MKRVDVFSRGAKSHLALGVSLLLAAGWGVAAEAGGCAGIVEDASRLACYDAHYRPQAAPALPATLPSAAMPGNGVRAPSRGMVEAWDLEPDHAGENFTLRTYKPVYLLLANHTNHINRQPRTGNPDTSAQFPMMLDPTEVKFQLSLKTRLVDNLIGNNGSLWLGYTQSSYWQTYNDKLSQAFRESNYEPEVMFVLRTPFEFAGWQGRMTSLSLNHQSNGRALPLSRSWNRLILQLGMERGDLSVLIRPWWRIPESAADNDNPHIENYVGRGEIIVSKHLGEHILSLQARHTFRGGDDARGSLRLDWSIPISGRLKGYLSVFSGYGESLIDFNHRQTTLGAGFSLVDW